MSSDQPPTAAAPASQPVAAEAPLSPLSSNPVNPPPPAAIGPDATTTAPAPPVEAAAPPATTPAAPGPEATAPVAKSAPQLSLKLTEFLEALPSILTECEHSEMWGVQLRADPTHIPTVIVLQKFMRANPGELEKAKTQFTEALKWRKKMNPTKLADDVYHDRSKFGGLGYITVYGEGEKKEVVTWNIYGAVKDIKSTFGDVEQFLQWRTSLMELSLRPLNLPLATAPLPSEYPAGHALSPPNNNDPYRTIQVHDYHSISFLRMDPHIRAASKATIQAFATAYPELLKSKYFVNVPLAMSWVFQALKVFLSKETVAKFHPLSYGKSLAGEMGEVGSLLPVEYGGKGKGLGEIGSEVKFAGETRADDVD